MRRRWWLVDISTGEALVGQGRQQEDSRGGGYRWRGEAALAQRVCAQNLEPILEADS